VTAVALLAAKGSPGVTTLACAMVLAWTERGAVLVEADQHGGDLALLHAVSQSPGLAELAARAKRATTDDLDLLAPYIRPLAGGALPTVLAPVDGSAVRAALNVLADRPGLFAPTGPQRTLLFDLGRVEPESPGWMWANACDRVLLVSRTDLTGLGHAATLAQRLRESEARAALALIDSGPYPPAEAEQTLGLPVAGVLPWSPKHARALTDLDAVRAAAGVRLAARAGEVLDAAMQHDQEVPVP
jgi:MinD-like ATPase involved in chromosome partitioning or flagellar assembly